MTGSVDRGYVLINEANASKSVAGVYGGQGSVEVGTYFRREGYAAPVLLATYRLRPSCSEGLHTHGLDDAQCGTLNEFYYIVSGSGEMTIGDRIVPVSKGDYVYIPSGVSRAIANASGDEDLRVHIVAIPAKS